MKPLNAHRIPLLDITSSNLRIFYVIVGYNFSNGETIRTIKAEFIEWKTYQSVYLVLTIDKRLKVYNYFFRCCISVQQICMRKSMYEEKRCLQIDNATKSESIFLLASSV